MERRKRFFARLRTSLLALLKLVLAIALGIGVNYGTKYVNLRSEQEIEKIKNRPQPQWYLEVDQPVRMVVVDDQGKMSMEISGKTVRLSKDQKKAYFSGAHAVYYENGETSLTMDAGEIEYNTITEDFNLTKGLAIITRDGMTVTADQVEWRRFKQSNLVAGSQPPSFRFPKGVDVASAEGNRLHADYMQADKDLLYMEFVGHVGGDVQALQDTGFISGRGLTDAGQLKLEDFQKLKFSAEQLIYDKRNQVVLATSRFYDRSFKIRDLDGRVVKPETYQPQPQQVNFSKDGVTISANHIEAHISKKWVEGVGNIGMIVPPSAEKASDDKALRVMRKYETRLECEDVEYFWGRDYILTHGRTRVEQNDRMAMADQAVYWGDEKMVLLDGNITIVQGSGDWLLDNDLISVENHDMRRAVSTYTELYADRAVIYLNNNDIVASGNVRTRQDERETFADMIVYQDKIKRITASGNVKFQDKDGQSFLCGSLVYHNESKYMQVSKGASAAIRLPAKFANDINRALAKAREQAEPPEVVDPPVGEPTRRNPNEGSNTAGNVTAPSLTPGETELGPLTIPDGGGDVPPIAAPEGEGEGAKLNLKEGHELFVPLEEEKQPAKQAKEKVIPIKPKSAPAKDKNAPSKGKGAG